jgi:hydroxyethylthiazole kinase-like uncharacterized protein yjeF
MVKIVTVEEMRAVERATDAAGVSYAQMMQYAGTAVADIVIELLDEFELPGRIVVLVGPGNNGGDGLVAARVIAEETEAQVDCYLLKARDEDDEVYADALEAEVDMSLAEEDADWRELRRLLRDADVVIDSLLGTGARLPIEGTLKDLLDEVAAVIEGRDTAEDEPYALIVPALPEIELPERPAVVAVDCPSGLDCDTGELDPAALSADVTVTFAAAKFGQLMFPGAEAVGQLVVAGIGTPPDLPELDAVDIELATGERVRDMLNVRSSNSNKGTYGRAAIIAGSVNYVGAVALASEAAYRVGAGLVTAAIPASIQIPLASHIRETTWLLLPQDMGVISSGALEVLRDDLGEVESLLIGPGMGHEEPTHAFLRGLLQGEDQAKKGNLGFVTRSAAAEQPHGFGFSSPLVIDADGLNLLAEMEDWWTLLPANTILTPHPGEMGRLCQIDTAEVLSDRFGIAREKAAKWDTIVVLKGAFTLIAHPDGRLAVIPFATDALATAGTGDVLSGCIVGLLAQGIAPFEAAVSAAYVHALAGELAGRELGGRAVLAGDVVRTLPDALRRIEP